MKRLGMDWRHWAFIAMCAVAVIVGGCCGDSAVFEYDDSAAGGAKFSLGSMSKETGP